MTTVFSAKPPVAPYVPLPHEIERRRRIHLSVATYGYEIMDRPIMPDAVWDLMAQSVDRYQGTGHPLVDEFFLTQFSPMTGMWIHNHPELDGIKRLFDQYWKAMADYFEERYKRGLLRGRS